MNIKNNHKTLVVALSSGRLLSMIMNFLIPIFLSRYLSKDSFGIYAQFIIISQFAIGFFSFGAQSSLFYFYPTANTQKRRILIINTIVLLSVFALIAIVLFRVPFISKYLLGGTSVHNYYLYFSLVFLFGIFSVLLEVLYVVKSDLLTSILYPPLSQTIKAAVVLAFVFSKPGINSVLLGFTFSYFLIFLFSVFYIFKRIIENKGKKFFDFPVFLQQAKYSLPLGFASSIRILSQKIDRLVSVTYLNVSTYAVYSIAFYGVPGIRQIYDSISKVYIVKMTTEFQAGEIVKMNETYKSFVLKNLSYTIPVLLIVFVFAKTIIVFLFTNKYLDSVIYFQIYLFSFLFSAFGNGLILRASNNTKYSLVSYLLSAVVTIPLTFVLIKHWNIQGAIISAMMNVLAPRIFLTMYDLKVSHSKFSKLFPWKSTLIIGVVSVSFLIPVLIFKYFIEVSIYNMIFASFVYLILVFIVEVRMNVFVIDNKVVYQKLTSFYKKIKARI